METDHIRIEPCAPLDLNDWVALRLAKEGFAHHPVSMRREYLLFEVFYLESFLLFI